MKISIALATYNGEKYLQEQLDSILNQTRLPDELVIVDDVSCDETLKLIEKFSRSAPFDVVFRINEKNQGYTKNFNKALSLATGDLIFLCDQDDFWFPEKIEKISELSQANMDAMLFMNDAYIADDNLNYYGNTIINQVIKLTGSEKNFVTGCCIAVKREMLELCLPVAENYPGHDGWLVRFSDALKARMIIHNPLQIYRRHAWNVSPKTVTGTQVSSLNLLLYKVRKFINSILINDAADVDVNILSSKSFLDRLYSAGAVCEGIFSTRIQAAITDLELDINILLKRKALRAKKIPVRFVLVINYWARGYYARFSGVYSLMRDLFGRSQI